jgi:hypothetical protein
MRSPGAHSASAAVAVAGQQRLLQLNAAMEQREAARGFHLQQKVQKA